MTTLTTTTATTSSVSKGKKPYKSWLKDGVNGGMSSMDVLIHWLADKTNYSKWRGGDNNAERTPKKVLLEEIIERMRQVGIYHRLPKDVASKISTLQSNYRTAREWNDTEGKKLRQAGVKEEIVHEEIVKRFPYWDALHGSFGNFRTSPSWPMSISSIMDREEEEQQQQQLVGKNEHHHHQQQQQRHYRPQLHHHNTSPPSTNTYQQHHSPPHPHHHSPYSPHQHPHYHQQQRHSPIENLDTRKLMTAAQPANFLLPPPTSASSSTTNTSSSSSSYFHRDESEEESSFSSILPSPMSNTTSFTTHNNTSSHSMMPSTGRRRRRMSDSHLIHLLHNMKQPRLNETTITEGAFLESATSPPPIPIPTTRHASHPNPITTSTSPTTTNNNNNNNSDTNSNAIAVNDDDLDDDDHEQQRSIETKEEKQQSSLSPPAPVQDDEDDEEQGDPSTATGKRYDSEELGESLLKVTREKEAGQLKRSHDMLEFQREKRLEREQLLIEQERTRRIRAKAELVKNLMEAGFTKQEIAEQLQFI